jgi:hypothetical protein
MKKFIATILLSTMLMSQANAGILILTGNIGTELKNPKLIGWILILFSVTGVGLVLDEDEALNDEFNYELSEASLELLAEATADVKEQAALEGREKVMTTVSVELAEEIADYEGYTGEERIKMISILSSI